MNSKEVYLIKQAGLWGGITGAAKGRISTNQFQSIGARIKDAASQVKTNFAAGSSARDRTALATKEMRERAAARAAADKTSRKADAAMAKDSVNELRGIKKDQLAKAKEWRNTRINELKDRRAVRSAEEKRQFLRNKKSQAVNTKGQSIAERIRIERNDKINPIDAARPKDSVGYRDASSKALKESKTYKDLKQVQDLKRAKKKQLAEASVKTHTPEVIRPEAKPTPSKEAYNRRTIDAQAEVVRHPTPRLEHKPTPRLEHKPAPTTQEMHGHKPAAPAASVPAPAASVPKLEHKPAPAPVAPVATKPAPAAPAPTATKPAAPAPNPSVNAMHGVDRPTAPSTSNTPPKPANTPPATAPVGHFARNAGKYIAGGVAAGGIGGAMYARKKNKDA